MPPMVCSNARRLRGQLVRMAARDLVHILRGSHHQKFDAAPVVVLVVAADALQIRVQLIQ